MSSLIGPDVLRGTTGRATASVSCRPFGRHVIPRRHHRSFEVLRAWRRPRGRARQRENGLSVAGVWPSLRGMARKE